jgi:hypothetical protein
MENKYSKPTENDILRKLRHKMFASCECQTKTPDFRWHKEDCLYRILSETDHYICELHSHNFLKSR